MRGVGTVVACAAVAAATTPSLPASGQYPPTTAGYPGGPPFPPPTTAATYGASTASAYGGLQSPQLQQQQLQLQAQQQAMHQQALQQQIQQQQLLQKQHQQQQQALQRQGQPQAQQPAPPVGGGGALGNLFAGGASGTLQRLGQLTADIAHCDPKTEGVCCVAKDYCDINADCFSDVSPENIFDWANAIPRCTCRWGFQGDGKRQGTGCSNINECQTGEAGCEQVCHDLAPGFACGCWPGYELLPNGKQCQDINECNTNNGGCHHICINTLGSFKCGCLPGFSMAPDGRSCIELDACAAATVAEAARTSVAAPLGPPQEATSSKGPCQHQCKTELGLYRCTCPLGYKLSLQDLSSCLDRNECDEGLGNGAPACGTDGSQICTNKPGSYSCACAPGYELKPASSVKHQQQLQQQQLQGTGQLQQLPQGSQMHATPSAAALPIQQPSYNAQQPHPIVQQQMQQRAQQGYEQQHQQQLLLQQHRQQQQQQHQQHDQQVQQKLLQQFQQQQQQKSHQPATQQQMGPQQISLQQGAPQNQQRQHLILQQQQELIRQQQLELLQQQQQLQELQIRQRSQAGAPLRRLQIEKTIEGFVKVAQAAHAASEASKLSHGKGSSTSSSTSSSAGKDEVDPEKLAQMAKQFFVAAETASSALSAINTISGHASQQQQQHQQQQHQRLVSTNAALAAQMGTAAQRFVPSESYSAAAKQVLLLQREVLQHIRKPRDPPTPPQEPLVCQDIDECAAFAAAGKPACSHPDLRCINVPGSYECKCPLGYEVRTDGGGCQDVDECLLAQKAFSPVQQQAQQQQQQQLVPLQQQQHDEIKRGLVAAARQKQGGQLLAGAPAICEQSCTNIPGSYKCSCLPGYDLQPDGRCIDVDECALGQHTCTHICENIPGSYRCRCPLGYITDPFHAGKCVDIDECTNGSHKCSHGCVNTEGSYRCECPGGFSLAQDKRTCLPPRTCLEDPTICRGDFVCARDPPTGQWVCRCPEGFQPAGGSSAGVPECVDVDECIQGYPQRGLNPCTDPLRPCCLNITGGFQCLAMRRRALLDPRSLSCEPPSFAFSAYRLMPHSLGP